jgi:hypothetical protein
VNAGFNVVKPERIEISSKESAANSEELLKTQNITRFRIPPRNIGAKQRIFWAGF